MEVINRVFKRDGIQDIERVSEHRSKTVYHVDKINFDDRQKNVD